MEFTKDIEFNMKPTVNEDLTITYNGYLSGSNELSIVYGYGDSWENTNEQNMQKEENGFITTIKLLDYDTFNFCFKNSNNEWDNNSYCNYITAITPAVNNQTFDIDSLIEELLLEPISVSQPSSEGVNFVVETEENQDLGYQLSNMISNINEENKNLVEYNTLEEILTATKIENSTDFDFSTDFPQLETVDDTVTASNFISEESSVEKVVTTNYYDNYYDDVFEDFINNSSFATFNNEEKNDNITYTTNNYDNVFEEFMKNLSNITDNHGDVNNNTASKVEKQNKIVLEPLIDESAFQTIIGSSSKNEETALIKASDSFIVSSRKLGSFYMFKKKMKLILYKVFVKIPKLLLGLNEKE